MNAQRDRMVRIERRYDDDGDDDDDDGKKYYLVMFTIQDGPPEVLWECEWKGDDYPSLAITSRSPATVLAQDDWNAPTLQLDHQGVVRTLHHAGLLLDCWSGDRLVYQVKNARGDWEIMIHGEGDVTTLRPSRGQWEGRKWLSVCETIHGNIVVTDADSSKLHIFNNKHEEMRVIELSYKPWKVVWGLGYIIVCDENSPYSLHVYGAAGNYLHELPQDEDIYDMWIRGNFLICLHYDDDHLRCYQLGLEYTPKKTDGKQKDRNETRDNTADVGLGPAEDLEADEETDSDERTSSDEEAGTDGETQ